MANSSANHYQLTLLEERILCALEREPTDPRTIANFGANWNDAVEKLRGRNLLWWNAGAALFYITADGMSHVRAIGKSTKGRPTWRHNAHEMTAERAIEVFVPDKKPKDLAKVRGPRVKRSKKVNPNDK